MDKTNQMVFIDKVITKDVNKKKHMKEVSEICSRLRAFICDHTVEHGIWTTIIYEVPAES